MREAAARERTARGGSPRGESSREGVHLSGVAGEMDLRWAAVELTAAAEEARRRHDLSPIAAAALGRALAGATLLRSLATRACARLVLTVAGDGALGNVVAEADAQGNVRGMVGNPSADLPSGPDGKLRIGEAVGKGTLRVRRELADGSTSESQVSLVNGEIGLDLAHYLEQSEQTPSAVVVGVLAGREGVRSAGGLIAEVIPGAGEAILKRLEANLRGLDSYSRQLGAIGLDRVVRRVFAGVPLEVREREGVRFRCRCDREALLPRLAALSEADLREIAAPDGTIVAQCAFCGVSYLFDPQEIDWARQRAAG